MLTGEYLVLDGATALAIPTKYGQSLEVITSENEGFYWKSYDKNRTVWFEDVFDLKNFKGKNPENPISQTLTKILSEARILNPTFLIDEKGVSVTTNIDFPRNWGLGTSSTLINNIALWANVDAFKLLKNSFGGSGYDIAVAQASAPIFYKLKDDIPEYKKIKLTWDFTDRLFFIHLNKKQNSKEGISSYRKSNVDKKQIEKITDISRKLLMCYTLSDFENLVEAHEAIISSIIQMPTIKEQLFTDYPHIIKSLGAWGGDFVLATGNATDMEYFRKKGFETIVPFNEMMV